MISNNTNHINEIRANATEMNADEIGNKGMMDSNENIPRAKQDILQVVGEDTKLREYVTEGIVKTNHDRNLTESNPRSKNAAQKEQDTLEENIRQDMRECESGRDDMADRVKRGTNQQKDKTKGCTEKEKDGDLTAQNETEKGDLQNKPKQRKTNTEQTGSTTEVDATAKSKKDMKRTIQSNNVDGTYDRKSKRVAQNERLPKQGSQRKQMSDDMKRRKDFNEKKRKRPDDCGEEDSEIDCIRINKAVRYITQKTGGREHATRNEQVFNERQTSKCQRRKYSAQNCKSKKAKQNLIKLAKDKGEHQNGLTATRDQCFSTQPKSSSNQEGQVQQKKGMVYSDKGGPSLQHHQDTFTATVRDLYIHRPAEISGSTPESEFSSPSANSNLIPGGSSKNTRGPRSLNRLQNSNSKNVTESPSSQTDSPCSTVITPVTNALDNLHKTPRENSSNLQVNNHRSHGNHSTSNPKCHFNDGMVDIEAKHLQPHVRLYPLERTTNCVNAQKAPQQMFGFVSNTQGTLDVPSCLYPTVIVREPPHCTTPTPPTVTSGNRPTPEPVRLTADKKAPDFDRPSSQHKSVTTMQRVSASITENGRNAKGPTTTVKGHPKLAKTRSAAGKGHPCKTEQSKTITRTDKVGSNNNRRATITDKVGSNNNTTTTTTDKVCSNNNKTTTITDRFASNNKTTKITEKVGSNNNKTTTITDKVGSNNNKTTTITDKVGSNNNETTTITDKVGSNNKKTTTITDKVGSNNSKTTTTTDKVANNKTTTATNKVGLNNKKTTTITDKFGSNNNKTTTILDKVVQNNNKTFTPVGKEDPKGESRPGRSSENNIEGPQDYTARQDCPKQKKDNDKKQIAPKKHRKKRDKENRNVTHRKSGVEEDSISTSYHKTQQHNSSPTSENVPSHSEGCGVRFMDSIRQLKEYRSPTTSSNLLGSAQLSHHNQSRHTMETRESTGDSNESVDSLTAAAPVETVSSVGTKAQSNSSLPAAVDTPNNSITNVNLTSSQSTMTSNEYHWHARHIRHRSTSDATEDSTSTNPAQLEEILPHECNVCGKRFMSKGGMRCHRSSVHKPRQCAVCGHAFLDVESLKSHLLTQHRATLPQYQIQCQVCNKDFSRRFQGDLVGHLMKHIGRYLYTCDVCGKGFPRAYQLMSHIQRHCGILPPKDSYKCLFCTKTFRWTSCYSSHLKRHLEIPPPRKHSCSYCGKAFMTITNLKHHIRTHTGDKPFKCSICGRGFAQKVNMEKHEQIHSGERPFQCTICQHSYKRNEHLKKHMQSHLNEKKYKCDVCGMTFNVDRLLASHKTIHEEKRYTCSVCGKKFRRAHHVKTHMNVHEGRRDYKCTVCGKGLADERGLRNHLKMHMDVREYECDHCGLEVRDRRDLLRHVQSVHEKVKRCFCNVCGMGFFRVPHLKEHIRRRHLQERSHLCTICKRAFFDQHALNLHMKMHKKTQNNPFECHVCHTRFKRSHTLRKHMEKQHDLRMGRTISLLKLSASD